MASNGKSDGASISSPVSDNYKDIDMQMDGALSYIQNAGNDASPVDEKLVVRKIDWRIIPIMFACYTMQFLDKVLINVSLLFQQAL